MVRRFPPALSSAVVDSLYSGLRGARTPQFGAASRPRRRPPPRRRQLAAAATTDAAAAAAAFAVVDESADSADFRVFGRSQPANSHQDKSHQEDQWCGERGCRPKRGRTDISKDGRTYGIIDRQTDGWMEVRTDVR